MITKVEAKRLCDAQARAVCELIDDPVELLGMIANVQSRLAAKGHRSEVTICTNSLREALPVLEAMRDLIGAIQQGSDDPRLGELTEAMHVLQHRQAFARLRSKPGYRVREWLEKVRLRTLTDSEFHATEADLAELEAILR